MFNSGRSSGNGIGISPSMSAVTAVPCNLYGFAPLTVFHIPVAVTRFGFSFDDYILRTEASSARRRRATTTKHHQSSSARYLAGPPARPPIYLSTVVIVGVIREEFRFNHRMMHSIGKTSVSAAERSDYLFFGLESQKLSHCRLVRERVQHSENLRISKPPRRGHTLETTSSSQMKGASSMIQQRLLD